MINQTTFDLITGGIKLLPEVAEVGKDVWKKLREPEQLGRKNALNGITANTYYSGEYNFSISAPSNNWMFWKPTPLYLATLGLAVGPTADVPIIIISRNMVDLFRPNVVIIVEEIGDITNIEEITKFSIVQLQQSHCSVDKSNIRIDNGNNSSMMMTNKPYYNEFNMYQVHIIYLYSCKAFYLTASYVPQSKESPQMQGGLQEIMNSFKLIK